MRNCSLVLPSYLGFPQHSPTHHAPRLPILPLATMPPSLVCHVDICSFLTQTKPSLGCSHSAASIPLYHLAHCSVMICVDACASFPPQEVSENRGHVLFCIPNDWVLSVNANTFISCWYFSWASLWKWAGFDAREHQEPDRKSCLGGTDMLLYLISEVGDPIQYKLARA